MEFKTWLVNEGAMWLPYKSYKKVVDFYIQARSEYAMEPKKQVPPKTIPLDLEGTSYDFLTVLNPKLTVSISNSETVPETNAAGAYIPWSFRRTSEETIGEIKLAAKAYDLITSTIEHEILHFVQELIKVYSRESVATNPNRRDQRWILKNGQVYRPGYRPSKKERESNFRLGGLPDKEILSRLLKKYDVDGYVHGSEKQRRTTHAYRPIEQMTNLATHIADLKMGYLNTIINELQINPLETSWEELKKNPEFIKRLSDKKRKAVFTSPARYKSLDSGAYKLYHKEIFKKFIDSIEWEDTFELLQARKNLEGKLKEVQKEKDEKSKKARERLGLDLKGYTLEDFGKGVRVKIEYSDRGDLSNIGQYISPEEADSIDGYDAAEEMLQDLGIKENDDGYFTFSASATSLKRLFDKIRKLKKSETLQVKKCDWDYFARKIAYYAADKLNDYMYKTSRKQIDEDKLLSIFYPDPPEICREQTFSEWLSDEDKKLLVQNRVPSQLHDKVPKWFLDKIKRGDKTYRPGERVTLKDKWQGTTHEGFDKLTAVQIPEGTEVEIIESQPGLSVVKILYPTKIKIGMGFETEHISSPKESYLIKGWQLWND